jgi:phenylalanyl-tRNA synthetase beta chain
VALYDVSRLVGEELSAEELSELLPRLKCEVERVEGGYIDYEATHDRPDLFSAEGLARALKGNPRAGGGAEGFPGGTLRCGG